MNGDKYSDDTIVRIKILSLDNSEITLKVKKEICCIINGFNLTDIGKMSRFNKLLHKPNEIEFVMKPQYFHSACAIYLLINYPSLRNKESFINIVIRSNIENECLKIATDVLKSDSDGIDFINNIQNAKGNVCIIDEENKTKYNKSL